MNIIQRWLVRNWYLKSCSDADIWLVPENMHLIWFQKNVSKLKAGFTEINITMNLTYTMTDETQGKRIIYSCPCFPSSIDPKTFILLLIALLLPQYSALLYPAASRVENKPYKYTTFLKDKKNLFIFFHSFIYFQRLSFIYIKGFGSLF
jgi:hypothetical protein